MRLKFTPVSQSSGKMRPLHEKNARVPAKAAKLTYQGELVVCQPYPALMPWSHCCSLKHQAFQTFYSVMEGRRDKPVCPYSVNTLRQYTFFSKTASGAVHDGLHASYLVVKRPKDPDNSASQRPVFNAGLPDCTSPSTIGTCLVQCLVTSS